jgi:hypothetical protein
MPVQATVDMKHIGEIMTELQMNDLRTTAEMNAHLMLGISVMEDALKEK